MLHGIILTWWLGSILKMEGVSKPLLLSLFSEYSKISGCSCENDWKIPMKLRKKKSEKLPSSVEACLILMYAGGSNLCPFVSKVIWKSLIGKYLSPFSSVGLSFQTYSNSSSVLYKLSEEA